MLGGNSDGALRRVARWGDGWYGFNLDGVAAARERAGALRALCAEAGRDPDALSVAVALTDPDPADLPALADAGVTQLVIVASPPAGAAAADAWTAELARRWVAAA